MRPPLRPSLPSLCLFLCLALGGRAAAPDAAPVVSVPRITHPGLGQVIYFVLTDRFANGSSANDAGGIAGDADTSGFDPTRTSHYHGGDFIGLTSKLDYLQQLGVTAIWVTPPFENDATERHEPYGVSTGYHGYWIRDFTRIDPHLGTLADFKAFIAEAHKRSMRVYVDIVINHTADVNQYRDGSYAYVDTVKFPYRDGSGKPFDAHAVAYNGIGPGDFPALSETVSFPHVPFAPAGREHARKPEWLNDLTLYHNRGDSTWEGESAQYGDFAGLDDVFTENPRVVRGFIDVYGGWVRDCGFDGYRIDTVKHVNLEFWQAFATAIKGVARQAGRPDFIQFGEVMAGHDEAPLRSEFTTNGRLDGIIDFGFFDGARDFVSKGADAAGLSHLFELDDYYTCHDANAQNLTTFVSNHDGGRFCVFLKQDDPAIGPAVMARLDLLAQDLLLTVRGQPQLYYGDEQGMAGYGGDAGSREDMFPSQTPQYRDLPLLGTTRTGRDDKFDPSHPFYRHIAALAAIRTSHPGLALGAMLLRPSGNPHVFAFSRIERAEQVEYLVAVNNSRTQAQTVTLATCQPEGARLDPLFDSESAGARGPSLKAAAGGAVAVTLAPMQLCLWKAATPLPAPSSAPTVRLAAPAAGSELAFGVMRNSGHVIPIRQEVRAEVSGGDGFAEVTFVLERASRPGQFELLGTADRPPYRVFWRPPADLAAGDTLAFVATVDDLRGHRASSRIGAVHVAPSPIEFGIRGAQVPLIVGQPPAQTTVRPGSDLVLLLAATGTAPLEFRWLHDGREVPGAAAPILSIQGARPSDAGSYRAVIHDREGTTVSADYAVRLSP